MKALTVWQPWASLIVFGAKPYEFRGWRFPRSMLGERIVIHAAARKVDGREVERLLRMLDRGGWWAAHTCLHVELARAILRGEHGPFPIGCALGSAVLGEPRIGTDVAAEFGVDRANDSDRNQHANWGWPMLDVERWAEPIPMKGAQGFWNWPTPAALGLY